MFYDIVTKCIEEFLHRFLFESFPRFRHICGASPQKSLQLPTRIVQPQGGSTMRQGHPHNGYDCSITIEK